MSDLQSIYTVSMISPALFDPFAHQARKIFHDHELGTLLDSIRDKGIKTPLTARRSKTNPERLELVAGERRLRAAKQLGLAEVPVFIRDLSDTDAEEESLIENMARVNLTPVEEANAFKRMLELEDAAGQKLYSIKSLAKKLARGEADIRAGLKMLNAPDSLLKEIDTTKEERRVSVEVVALIGRIPDPKAREKAAADVLSGASLTGGAPSGKPLVVKEVRKLVRTRYMAKINLSAKEQEDESLVPMELAMVDGVQQRVRGGSCKDCPFRSGCMTDIADLLQGEVDDGKSGRTSGVDPDLCTLPSCLKAKNNELWARRKEKHLQDGGRVLTDAESKKEFSWEDRLRYDSPYAKLTDKPEGRVFPGKYDLGTWAQLTKGLPVVVTLARLVELQKEVKLITIKEAAELVRGRWKEAAKDEDSVEDAAAKAARAKELRTEKIEKESVKIGLRTIEDRVTKTGLSIDQWRALFEIILSNAGSDGMTVLGQWLEIKLPKGGHKSGRDYEEAIIAAVQAKVTTVNGWQAWCVLASVARGIKYAGANASDYKAVIEALEIDVKALKTEATKAVDAKLKKPAGDKKAVKPERPLKPGEKGDTEGMYDRGQSGASVDVIEAKQAETVYDAATDDESASEEPGEAKLPPTTERVAAPDQEAKALEVYLRTGSLDLTADETGIKLGTLQNWHKRRKWAALRKAAQKTK
jgi:ParB family chromosome partitioning protein